ncbi:glycosyltransferase [Paracoccus zhejiangensis]|uniref:Colanic acid biosynthesis glycosyltransferase WcaL n=1 Tax=Paracoccus zhejiangensis TaxID=1077935 RepID=A0A2H5EW91_9RHOB|nr:glycosyltransferase [Paracoccus zhejiangensis]AUH63562.1 colanic acid biosynthesis glycosyltransferase WcaL [Paracoccus zhejiangensis]
MRVAYLINQYPKVSHSFIRREILALERQGVSVHRMALRGWDAEVVDPEDRDEQARTSYTLQGGLRPLAGSVWRRLRRDPRGLWRAFRAASAMSRNGVRPWPYHMVYVAHACRIMDWLEVEPAGHLHAHFGTNTAEIARLVNILGGPGYSFTVHGPEEFDNPVGLHLGGKLASAGFCATVSSYGRSQMYRWASAGDWAKVKVVHCGLDLSRWADPLPLPPGPFHMVAVGRFAEQKGFGLLIRGFAPAWRREPSLRLSLVGDGELRPAIEAMIAAEGMGDAVRILGWQDEAGVLAAIDSAHALVAPSFAEGLPVVIMEAMARARPIIATYIAGIPELVRPGSEGWLVPAGDADALAEVMLAAAATDPGDLAQMGQTARARVVARHDVDVSAAKLAELFSQGLKGGG